MTFFRRRGGIVIAMTRALMQLGGMTAAMLLMLIVAVWWDRPVLGAGREAAVSAAGWEAGVMASHQSVVVFVRRMEHGEMVRPSGIRSGVGVTAGFRWDRFGYFGDDVFDLAWGERLGDNPWSAMAFRSWSAAAPYGAVALLFAGPAAWWVGSMIRNRFPRRRTNLPPSFEAITS